MSYGRPRHMIKNSPVSAIDAGDVGLIPVAKISWELSGTPLWYFCLENPMNTADWHAAVHEVKSQMQLSTHKCHSEVLNTKITSRGGAKQMQTPIFGEIQAYSRDYKQNMSLSPLKSHFVMSVAVLSPGDLCSPGVKPGSPTLWAVSWLSEPQGYGRAAQRTRRRRSHSRGAGGCWGTRGLESENLPPCSWGVSSP